MCIQDYALAQNQYVKSTASANADGSGIINLPASKNRTRIIVSFDPISVGSSMVIQIFRGTSADNTKIIAAASGSFPYVASIFDYGSDIQGPITIVGIDTSGLSAFYVTDIWNNIPDNALLSYQQINPKGN